MAGHEPACREVLGLCAGTELGLRLVLGSTYAAEVIRALSQSPRDAFVGVLGSAVVIEADEIEDLHTGRPLSERAAVFVSRM